jgi:hypothetical protein
MERAEPRQRSVLPAQAGWHAVYWTTFVEHDGTRRPDLYLRPILGWVVELTEEGETIRPIIIESTQYCDILNTPVVAKLEKPFFLGFLPPQETLADHDHQWQVLLREEFEREELFQRAKKAAMARPGDART